MQIPLRAVGGHDGPRRGQRVTVHGAVGRTQVTLYNVLSQLSAAKRCAASPPAGAHTGLHTDSHIYPHFNLFFLLI